MGRTIRHRVTTLLVIAGSLALLLSMAPPDSVLHQIDSMRPGWLLVVVAFELASCVCYVVIFRHVFPEPARGSWRIAWIAVGVGAVLPGGNLASAVSTGLLLRGHEIDTRTLARRCGALLCLLTACDVLINAVAALLMITRVDSRPYNLLLSLAPLTVSLVLLAGSILLVRLVRRRGARTQRVLGMRGQLVLVAVAVAVQGGFDLLRDRNWRLLGAFGYGLLDMGALWAAARATGHPLGVPPLIIAYCAGYLATVIPTPAGIGVLDSGLSSVLVLYGMAGPAAIGAVLAYHLVSVWLPGLGGLVAWLPTRYGRARGPLATSTGTGAVVTALRSTTASAADVVLSASVVTGAPVGQALSALGTQPLTQLAAADLAADRLR